MLDVNNSFSRASLYPLRISEQNGVILCSFIDSGFCLKNLLILVVLVVGRQIDFALLIDFREGIASTRGGGGWEAGPDGLIERTVCGGQSTSLTLISM